MKDAMEAEGEDVPLRQIRDVQDQEIKPILFFLHRSPSHAVTKARLYKLKMSDDSADFAVYQKYKKAFELEVLFAGPDFALPPK